MFLYAITKFDQGREVTDLGVAQTNTTVGLQDQQTTMRFIIKAQQKEINTILDGLYSSFQLLLHNGFCR